MTPQLIIGLGTGHCGTKTLAYLLGMQDGAYVTHERFTHRMKWDEGQIFVRHLVAAAHSARRPLYGDVALSWLPRAESLMDAGARLIVLQRAREATIRSFLKATAATEDRPARNYWQPEDEGGTAVGKWWRAFPQYKGCSSKREALGRYWDAYYEECIRLMEQYPRRVLWAWTRKLSLESEQRRILSFVGYEDDEMRIDTSVRIRTKGEFKQMVG